MNDTSMSDEARMPNFFSIYESSIITTTDEGTKAGKIIRGYVEETLKEARREYRFRDETERKLRRLQEQAGHTEGRARTEACRNGIETLAAVNLKVLAGVHDVEARSPECHGQAGPLARPRGTALGDRSQPY